MNDLLLFEGDLAAQGNDLVVRSDHQDYLLKSLTTPRGYLSQLTWADGLLVDIDTDYGNAIYELLSEAFTPSLADEMRQAVIDASRGAATQVVLTFPEPGTVNIDLTTANDQLQFTVGG